MIKDKVLNKLITEDEYGKSEVVSKIPEGYLGLSYKEKGETKMMSYGEYLSSIQKTSGLSNQDIIQKFGEAILTKKLHIMDSEAKEITADDINNPVLFNKILEMPFLTKDKQDLIDF